MALKYYNEGNIQNIANAIREIEGVERTEETEMYPNEMADRISNLIWTGTQLEYDALTKSGYPGTTLYIIFES